VATKKVLILPLLGSAILFGVFKGETREQKGPEHRSMQQPVQRNLAKVLEDDEDGAKQLFLLGDQAVSPLIRFLSDPDQAKRVAAAKGLAYIGSPKGMEALRNAIKTEKDKEAKSGISCFLAGGLVDTKSESDLNFLRNSIESARHADDDDWDLPGFCAALALGMRGGSDSLLLLRKAAKPDDMEEIGKAIRWMEKESVPRPVTAGTSVSDGDQIKKIVLDGTFFAEEERDKTSVEQLTFNHTRNKVLVSLEIYQNPKSARGYDLVLAKKNGQWTVVGIWFGWIA
jgi:hypothetical protein